MSSQPGRSRLAEVARLVREAEAAESEGRPKDAARLLEEVMRLDPGDKRTVHRLGDLYALRLKRPLDAARCYAAEARAEERADFQVRALALWRIVVRCDPAGLEAHERIGALCVALGRVGDARAYYAATAERMERAGRQADGAVLRAHLAAIADFGAPLPDPPRGAGPAAAPPRKGEPQPVLPLAADENAVDLAADRLQNGRLYHHYGMHPQARRQLEELLASFPEHVEGRRLLVEVCRALDDQDAAVEHMRVLTRQLRDAGVARPPATTEEKTAEELPIEEWAGMVEEPADPMAELIDEIRADVERMVDALERQGSDDDR